MKLLKIFKNTRLENIFKPKNSNRNRAILKKAQQLGYPLPNIRKALVDLNGYSLKDIAKGQVSVSTVSKTIKADGPRVNKIALELISSKLNLEHDELFNPSHRLS